MVTRVACRWRAGLRRAWRWCSGARAVSRFGRRFCAGVGCRSGSCVWSGSEGQVGMFAQAGRPRRGR
eukprot:7589851-Alexandrium_andersonii.AAC.1